jgi:potassium-transporting ATPase potassium-binding subunit
MPLRDRHGATEPNLAFNTAVSFVTNTNWQNYGGESTMSYLVQMAGFTVQNFASAATGIAIAITLIRGFSRASGKSIGNFWVDLTRCTLYILLPICIALTLVYVYLGVPQTLGTYVDATTLEGAKQTIAVGPVASQLAIKMLGANGGGFFNANKARMHTCLEQYYANKQNNTLGGLKWIKKVGGYYSLCNSRLKS